MMYKVKVAVWSDIHTKHATQNERHVEILNVEHGGTERDHQALKGFKLHSSPFCLYNEMVHPCLIACLEPNSYCIRI